MSMKTHLNIRPKLLIGFVALALSSATVAEVKPEQAIKWRQSGYQFMAWNMARIKANLEGNFNKEEVAKAANTIQAIANSGMGSLYLPGTDSGKGWHETRVKPELFSDRQGVGKVAVDFVNAANDLAKTAASGNADDVKKSFGSLRQSCKACHENYRNEEH
jgi:cytochrome c556